MPNTHFEDEIADMYDTDEHAVTASIGGSSFPARLVIEDAPADMDGAIVENAVAYIKAMTKYVADVKTRILVTIGTADDIEEGSGLAGTGDDELVVDMDDSTIDTSGIRQLYVLRVAKYGRQDLQRQIFLSKDKP